MMDVFLQTSISRQIQLGITIAISFSNFLVLIFLVVTLVIKFFSIYETGKTVIDNEENTLLDNFNGFLENSEDTIIEATKYETYFLNTGYSNLFKQKTSPSTYEDTLENFDPDINVKLIHVPNVITDIDRANINRCSIEFSCYGYKALGNTQTVPPRLEKYLVVILPVLRSILNQKIFGSGDITIFGNFQFYWSEFVFFLTYDKMILNTDYSGEDYNTNISDYIDKNYYSLYFLVPQLNKLYSNSTFILDNFYHMNQHNPYVIDNYSLNQLPNRRTLYTTESDFISMSTAMINYNEEIDLSKCLKKNSECLEIGNNNFDSLLVLDWNRKLIENFGVNIMMNIGVGMYFLVTGIDIKNKVIAEDTTPDNINERNNFYSNYLLTPDGCIYLLKFAYGNITDLDVTKNKHIPNIKDCIKSTNSQFEEFMNDIVDDIFHWKKHTFMVQNYEMNNKNKLEKTNEFTFKGFQSYYPKIVLNEPSVFSDSKHPFLYNLVIVNDIIHNSYGVTSSNGVIKTSIMQYIGGVGFINFIVIYLVTIYITIRVFCISQKISKPIDKLIQSISNDKGTFNENRGKELKKQLAEISYEDDYTINELFIGCKKLIIGGFAKGENKFKEKKRAINSYNNICNVKTNNMELNESEIMQGVKKRDVNFFESDKDETKKHNNEDNTLNYLMSKKRKNEVDYKGGSNNTLFGDSFYKEHRYELIGNRICYDLIENEGKKKQTQNKVSSWVMGGAKKMKNTGTK